MVAIAFLIPLALLVKQVAHERAVAEAERQTAILVSVLAVTSDPNLVERMVASTDTGAARRIAVHGLTEDVIGTSRVPAADIRAAARQDQTVEVAVPDGIALLEPVAVGDGTVVVEVHVPDSALTAGVGRAQFALVVVAAGLVLGSAVIGDQLATRIVRPARNLARAATAFGDGDLDVRVPPSGPQELAEAGLAFNQMADRLATLRMAEREMVADLSHRLRTPLTGLRLDVEALEANDYLPSAGADADRHRTVARVRQALATLEHEIDVLIQTTRQATAQGAGSDPGTAAGGDAGSEPDRCDAGEVVAQRMSFWSAVAADQDRPCEVSGTASPAPVPVPASELAAAIDAVLGNAFRYTPQGTALEVAVSRRDGYVAVRVDDAGPGIADPAGAMQRGSSGRGSTGLGLDIARRVARAGGGSVSLDRSRDLGGASVVMILADAEAPPPPPPSRRGLVGRLAREPANWTHAARRGGARRWPRQRRPVD